MNALINQNPVGLKINTAEFYDELNRVYFGRKALFNKNPAIFTVKIAGFLYSFNKGNYQVVSTLRFDFGL